MSESPVMPKATPAARVPVPPIPTTLSETGLSTETIIDLLLRTLYVQGARTGKQLAETLRLPFTLLDDLLLTLQQRQMVEVRGTQGHSRAGYIFDLVGVGQARAREAMDSSQYVGPAPVPLAQYRQWIARQSIRNVRINRAEMERGFRGMIIEPELFEQLGPAINSARSLFLHGDPGNGKTMIAECIARMLGGSLYMPYAVEIDGQVMVLHDPVYHRPVETGSEVDESTPSWLRSEAPYDRRFMHIRRPLVITGGELTLEQLDLQYDLHTKMYRAPFQLKASGGVMIIDDFGRQRVPVGDLLNRWIIPLEKRIDFLTLHTGIRFPVPFDSLLIFSTNLEPHDLVDEAFLRRIHYKVHVDSPSPSQYEAIFRLCCKQRGVDYDAAAIEQIYRDYYQGRGIAPRSCHPRDILDHLLDAAGFLERPATLDPDLIERACHSYFLVMTGST